MWDHTVRSGESLWLIATRYKKNFNDVLQLNPQIKDRNKIFAGMSVHMPDPPPRGEVTVGPITVIQKPAPAPVQVPDQTSHAADSIDDDQVQGILDYAVDLVHKKKPQSDGVEEALDSWQILLVLRRWDDTPQTIQNYEQWQSLLELPQTPLDRNLNLMAAEHYSFARYVAAGCGDPHTEGVLKTYFAATSAVSFFPGGEKLLRTDPKHPVLPESPASRKWMAKGVQEGLLDYRNAHGGHLGENFSSRSVVTGNAGPQYKKAKDTLYGT
jgi:LysM domain